MIGNNEIAKMKQGAYLINAARGKCVDIDALSIALHTKKLLGAAIDVFPSEPKSADEVFDSPLCQFDNVILTPHIGGSTQEAQANIGIEVAEKLVRYSDFGDTISAVNFPHIALPHKDGTHRLLHIHQNVAGVLSKVNQLFANDNINIVAQSLMTDDNVGYLVMDVGDGDSAKALDLSLIHI